MVRTIQDIPEHDRAMLEGACDLIRQAANLAAPQPNPEQFEFTCSYLTIRLLNSMCAQQRADAEYVGEALAGAMKGLIVYCCNTVKADADTEQRLQYLKHLQSLFENCLQKIALATIAGDPAQERMWAWIEKKHREGWRVD